MYTLCAPARQARFVRFASDYSTTSHAHQTCVIAERRTDDLSISVLTAEGLRESEHAQRLGNFSPPARQSAAEHDTLRLEQIHKTCQTVRQIAAVFVEQLLRKRVPPASTASQICLAFS